MVVCATCSGKAKNKALTGLARVQVPIPNRRSWTNEMARLVLLFLLWLALCPAPASAQNSFAPPKMYFALAGSARDPRQQTLIKSLMEDVRRALRKSAIIAADKVDELPIWNADDATTKVPREFSRYVVASVEERYQSGLGMATMVTFEVGRLESTEAGRKLAFAGIPQQGLDVIVAPPSDERKPVEFTKFNGGWQFRPNSQIASEIVLWINAALPELQPPYTFYLMCSDANRTWTVADILSSESDLNGTVSAFLRKLAQNLEGRTLQPPWRSVFADVPSPDATRAICGTQDQALRERAHYILRGSLTDAQNIADSGVRQIQGVSVKFFVQDQMSASSFNTANAPENATNWSREFYARKYDAAQAAEQDVGDICANDVGVLTRNTQFADSVARYIRVKVYPKESSLDANWRCRKPEK
jgi:hypothetical protein